jgi:Flp pilus assembly protein TadG
MRKEGQSLVEFALVLPVFIAIMAGLLDGTRMLFTYNELQEAARAGARWGAVNVGRDPWGNSNNVGNGPCTACPTTGITLTSGISSTIVGQVTRKLIAVDPALTTIDIDSTGAYTSEADTQDGAFRINPVTVTVSYTFKPVLGFGHMNINLVGRNAQHHE